MWSFLVASIVLVVIPGPDQALITRNALSGGRRAGLATVFGGASGVGVHATAAAFGLSALIAASADAFTALKLCGVAYLLFLAVRTWRTAGHDEVAESDAVEHRSVRGFYRQGLLFDVLNPKVALFFLTFLPQFLPRNAGPAHALALAAIFGVTYLAWFTFYVACLDRCANWLRRHRVRRTIERATAGALVSFAARVALERR